ncbi:MAG: hypothetical protein JNK15_16310, partial [Planctomycetes bacterium]|nr:hypothetical protein [Planctomycetota bacterium]
SAEPAGDPLLLARSNEVLQIGGEPFAAARAAAVWLRASAHAYDDKAAFDVVALQIAVGDVQTATTLRASIEPMVHLRAPMPHRLAVAYALSRPPEVVVEQRAQWGSDAGFGAHVALALAFELARRPKTEPVAVSFPGIPEWQLVRAASGATAEAVPLADPVLAEVLRLHADGRLPRAALRTSLEDALWRHDGHPRLVPFELERLLVRDLLLSGSDPGTKYQPNLRSEKRYAPTGMGRDEEFFRIAVALFDFLAKVRSPMPAEHRLP